MNVRGCLKMNEHLKRVLDVAKKGKHTITIVRPERAKDFLPFGDDEYSKDFREVCDELQEKLYIFVRATCPCGNLTDPEIECTCTSRQLEIHKQQIPKADIYIEIPVPTWLEVEKELNLKQYSEDINQFLKKAFSVLHLSLGQVQIILRLAKTISELSSNTEVKLEHIAEAIQYQRKIKY